jgi:hypothetical protein
MVKEITPAKLDGAEPKRRESTEVAKPIRPDHVPIAEHQESYLEGLPDAEIASIEQEIKTTVERDYVEMLTEQDSKTAAIFFATRKAFRERGIPLEPAVLIGPKNRETRWGKLMLARIGMDLRDKRAQVTIYPRLARPVEGKTNGSVVALQAGMRSAALYLKKVYDWDAIPEYTVEGTGVSDDDIEGHDPRIKAARQAEIEASRPPRQIEKK